MKIFIQLYTILYIALELGEINILFFSEYKFPHCGKLGLPRAIINRIFLGYQSIALGEIDLKNSLY